MNNPNAAKNLKPWAKGQSGNPGGVGKDVAHIIGLAKENSQGAIETLASIMRDRKQAGQVRVSAANSILDRAYGKPKERVEAVVKQSLEDLVLASYRRSETIEHLPIGEPIEKVKTVAAVAQPSIAELAESGAIEAQMPHRPRLPYSRSSLIRRPEVSRGRSGSALVNRWTRSWRKSAPLSASRPGQHRSLIGICSVRLASVGFRRIPGSTTIQIARGGLAYENARAFLPSWSSQSVRRYRHAAE